MDALLALILVSGAISFGLGAAFEGLLRPRASVGDRVAAGLWVGLVGATVAAVAAFPFVG